MAAGTGESSAAHLWRGRVTAQQASGESIRAWCRGNRYHEYSFYWWRANLGLSPVGHARPKAVRSPAFARVVIADPVTERAEPIRLTLAGGRELILPGSMPVDQVARLVCAIESTATANEGVA